MANRPSVYWLPSAPTGQRHHLRQRIVRGGRTTVGLGHWEYEWPEPRQQQRHQAERAQHTRDRAAAAHLGTHAGWQQRVDGADEAAHPRLEVGVIVDHYRLDGGQLSK